MVRSVISLLILAVAGIRWQAQAPAFSVVEASIPEMQAAMKEGRITSREIVRQYLTRIALYEDKLNAVITVNPEALEEAEVRDRERAQGQAAPLQEMCSPVLLRTWPPFSFSCAAVRGRARDLRERARA